MNDYVYPGIYFAYFTFFLLFGFAVFFCVRSLKDGYFGPDGEKVKYQMLDDTSDVNPSLEASESARTE